jgi:hypothetical protein
VFCFHFSCRFRLFRIFFVIFPAKQVTSSIARLLFALAPLLLLLFTGFLSRFLTRTIRGREGCVASAKISDCSLARRARIFSRSDALDNSVQTNETRQHATKTGRYTEHLHDLRLRQQVCTTPRRNRQHIPISCAVHRHRSTESSERTRPTLMLSSAVCCHFQATTISSPSTALKARRLLAFWSDF